MTICGISLRSGISLSGLFCRSTSTPTPTPSTPTLTTAAGFTGAQGTGFGTAYGGSLPGPSATIIGTGYDEQPTVHFSTYPGEDVDASYTIICYARNIDPAAINYVEFTLEGGTPQQVNWMIKHPTKNLFGFPIKCNFDGVGILKARVVPNNGYEAVGYTLLRGVKSGVPADAVTYFVDPVSGSDAANGLTRGTAWKTLTWLLSWNGILQNWNASGEPSTIEGSTLLLTRQYSVIVTGSGNANLEMDLNDGNRPSGWGGRNTKKIVVKLDTGTTGVKLVRTTRGEMKHNLTWVEFQGIPVDTTNIINMHLFTANAVATDPLSGMAIVFAAGSDIKHPDGAAGPISLGYSKGVPAGETTVTQFFKPNMPFAIAESNFDSPNFAGVYFARNVRGYFAQFFQQYNTVRQSGSSIWDVQMAQKGGSEGRQHDPYELTVASIATNSPSAGQSTITLSGAPTIASSIVVGQTYLRFVSGAAVGQGGKTQGAGLSYYRMLADGTQDSTTYSYPPNADGTTTFNTVGFPVLSQDNTAKTIVITGLPTGVVAGDLVRSYYYGHPDVAEIIGIDAVAEPTGQIENIGWQNVKVVGPTQTTPFLIQSYTNSPTVGDSTTVTTSGTTISSYSGTVLRPGDFIRNTATGEYRRVKTASGGTGTLYDAFSANVSGATCSISRGPARFAMSNVIAHKTSINATPGDWQFGMANFYATCCTFIGRNSTNDLIIFSTDYGRTGTTTACFGMKNVRWGSSIIGGFTNNGSGSYTTTQGWKSVDADFHQFYGTKPFGGTANGALTFVTNFTGYVGTGALTALSRDVLQVPYDIAGNARSTSSPMGAQVA